MEPRRAENSPLQPNRRWSPRAPDSGGLSQKSVGPATRSHGVQPYTAKPDFADAETHADDETRNAPRPRRWPMLAAVAAAVTLAATGLTLTLVPAWRPWSAQTQTAERAPLVLSAPDIDQAATAAARAALARGQIPPSLARVDAETRRRIAAGEESLYTQRLLNVPDSRPGEPQGSVRVRVSVVAGGATILDDTLTPEHPAVSGFPVSSGEPTRFYFTVERPGPNGTVTCRAWSNASGNAAQTRPLAAGESAVLDVIAR
jgi:hypothetical protein